MARQGSSRLRSTKGRHHHHDFRRPRWREGQAWLRDHKRDRNTSGEYFSQIIVSLIFTKLSGTTIKTERGVLQGFGRMETCFDWLEQVATWLAPHLVV
jgi:hypothetical protein